MTLPLGLPGSPGCCGIPSCGAISPQAFLSDLPLPPASSEGRMVAYALLQIPGSYCNLKPPVATVLGGSRL